ncbi:MAG: hypothetical protein OER80_11785 [Gammaproteobacteria bacterium]|nr:hypothetical protein [Gammaproteobacteria bacterium]
MEWTTRLEDNLFDDVETEHITISSEPLEEDDIGQDTPGITNRRFSQSSKAHNETRSFTIVDERFLAVCLEQPRAGKKQYRFNLAFLDPAPSRLSGVAWRWLYATLVLTGISIVAFGMSSAAETPLLEQRWLPVSVLLAVATIITFLVFIYRTTFTLTFHSLHGRAPLVEMAARNPGRSTVESFVLELQQRVEAARNKQWQGKAQFLRDELRAHYKLWEAGVLPDEIYEASKVRILGAHD